jgi:4-amino-4-deoxy-L-arabinose transferase-like glycosyltransferase
VHAGLTTCRETLQTSTRESRLHFAGALIVAMASSAIVLFYHLGFRPIELWDESRLANNAIEMAVSGFSLMTTYDWQPEHWSTKPPGLIWLMAASLRLFGFDELSIRLPGALAALGTTALLWVFIGIRLGKPGTACLSILLLLGERQFVLEHGARSGNYEPVLGFFTTAYVLAAYVYLHAETRRRLWLALAGGLVFLAFMTKGVQALIFLPAVGIVVIAARDWQRLLETATGAALLLLIIVVYYLLREQVDPGYFSSVLKNELIGRYGTALDGHHGGAWFYVHGPAASHMVAVGIVSSAALAWFANGETKSAARFLLACMACYLLVISISRTKISWYAFPLFPLAAASFALALAEAGGALSRYVRKRMAFSVGDAGTVALLLLSVAVVAYNLDRIGDQRDQVETRDACNKFLLSQEVRAASKSGLTIVQDGYDTAGYLAPTSFYAKILDSEGGRTVIVRPGAPLQDAFAYAVVCGADARSVVGDGQHAVKVVARANDIELLKVGEISTGVPIRRD